ncbi:MAG TPA: hypothetical protein VGP82_19920 [Ktedonobacterales bacterium]|nr:hypothetical protein [Ktedonobacterales bacterium]
MAARAFDVAAHWEGARAIYAELWEVATRVGDPYQARVIAHFMARAHVVAEAQLQWHLRALHSADAAASGDDRVRGFNLSLHANLGDVYLRLVDQT